MKIVLHITIVNIRDISLLITLGGVIKHMNLFNERVDPNGLSYVKESSSVDGVNFLGFLEGIFADSNKPTRNGHRYRRKLWENVFASDDFKEFMSTRTLFMEADHPEDRADSSLKEVAGIVLDMHLNDDGTVYGKAGILPTPRGRLVKMLLDFGVKIGVSTRGIGDEVVDNGETIIDDDTFSLFGIDFVCQPALFDARPKMVAEGIDLKRKTLIESIQSELDNATSERDVEYISSILEALNINDSAITESINSKHSSFVAVGSTEANDDKLLDESKKLTEKMKKLSASNADLKSKLEASNTRAKETRSTLKESRATSRELSRMLQESRRTNSKLEDDLLEGVRQIEDLSQTLSAVRASNKIFKYKFTSKIESLERQIRKLESDNAALKESNDSLTEELNSVKDRKEMLESRVTSYRDRITSMSSRNKTKVDALNKKIESLTGANSSLTEMNVSLNRELDASRYQIEGLSKKISDSDKSRKLTESKATKNSQNLSKQLESEKARSSSTMKEYIKLKCAQTGLDVDTVEGLLPQKYTTEDVNKIVSELSDRKDRLSKMHINMQPRTAILEESLSTLSAEDRQTYEILAGTIN